MAAMRGIPAINDLVTTGAVSSVRNNGQRRFFQPILIDRYGDRGTYQGQQLNAGHGAPGSLSDPNWNALADPRWSPDGTAVVYWQGMVTAPACGGTNPLPCPVSNEPGGRTTRLVIARLTSRTPYHYVKPAPLPDAVPWGTPYNPGDPNPVRTLAPEGTWTLKGKVSGSATITITHDAAHTLVSQVSVSYSNYSDDLVFFIDGTESVERLSTSSLTTAKILWHSNLRSGGQYPGTKITSEPDGFQLTIDIFTNQFNATGTLTTTIGGKTYTQPANGT